MAPKDVKSVLRPVFWIGACSIAMLVQIWTASTQAQTLSGRTIVYGTVVEGESGMGARIPGTVVTFLSSSGATTKIIADMSGEYSADLASGEKYSMTVKGKGFCTMSRPPFEAQPERRV